MKSSPTIEAAGPRQGTDRVNQEQQRHKMSDPRLQAAFSWFDSVKENVPSDTCTLDEWFRIVRSDRYRATTDRIRAIVATLPENPTKEEEDAVKKKTDPIKKTLPAVTFSAAMDTRASAVPESDRNYRHSGILQIDIDRKDNPGVPMAEIRQKLMDHPSMINVQKSPSGGLKAVMAIPASVDTHKAAFDAAKASLAQAGVNMDGKTHDIPRLCFLTHDPDAWLREGPAVVLEIPPVMASENKSDHIVIHNKHERDRLTLDDLAAMVQCTPRLDHDEWVNFINGAWHEFGSAATPIMEAQWPAEKPGEYQYRFEHRYTDKTKPVAIGTCIRLAQLSGGYRPPITARMASLNVTREHAERIAEAVTAGRFLAALDNEHRGLAQAYADIRFGQRCFVHDENIWRFYQDGVWLRDDTETTLDDLQYSLTPILVETVNDAVRKLDPKKDASKIDRLRKRARCLFNLKTARAVLENAAVLPEFRSMRGSFDQAPHLLAIENGVLDFSGGGEFRDHSSGHMLTVKAPITFDIDAKCPTFDQFLDDVTCGDRALVQFHWESLAIGLTGYTDFDFVWFHFGDGSNGKGTYTQTFREIFGPGVFRAFDSALLVGNRQSSSDDYKRASLEGVRIALGDELPDGRKLRTEELKKLIGGDAILGRNPYEKPRDFLPTHKTWLCGNHKPEITSMDHGTWRRLLLVPWKARFTGDGLARAERVAQHVAEASGILTRIMVAWAGVRENGLTIPAAVKEASEDYKQAADQVRQFADQRLEKMPGVSVALANVRIAYDRWCENEGEKPVATSNRKLGEELRRIGFETKSGAGNRTMLENAVISPLPKDEKSES
jgi:putative DNA primase/helicase